jgi:hypothetical protein
MNKLYEFIPSQWKHVTHLFFPINYSDSNVLESFDSLQGNTYSLHNAVYLLHLSDRLAHSVTNELFN